jgi:hypothetical protein
MLTHAEIRTVLKENYTVEELCDMIGLTPEDIVREFACEINDIQETILERIYDDLGWGGGDNEEE